jgi:uncharacterized membrane protein YfcA
MALKNDIGLLVVGTLLGVAISIPISKKIPDNKFDRGVNILMGIISIKILIEGVSELISA